MNYDLEIQNILDSIDEDEIKPLNVVNTIRNNVLNDIYNKFSHYSNNKVNRKETIDELESYEYIENNDDLKYGDKIRYLNKKYFTDLKISPQVSFISKHDNIINIRNILFYSSVKSNVYIFKYIPQYKLVKMKLLELLAD
tara:strand:- start:100 stop:519 length:420 start_codon:yes stop_codon:yes gene_type:complete